MNYFLFNNRVLCSDGNGIKVLENPNADDFSSIDKAKIVVLDVDMLITSAVEEPIEKKDSILVRKFKELYPQEAYIIQDERIDQNLFQIMGIKENKIRQIYDLIPAARLAALVPYGMALRACLVEHQFDLNKTIIFIEEQNDERFLTVLDGKMFSRTRIIDTHDDILSEIKRSQIDFFKKNEEFLNRKNSEALIVTNSQSLSFEILKRQKEILVQYLDVQYPSLEGLKNLQTDIKYRLPEDILQRRKAIELNNRISVLSFSFAILSVAVIYFVFNQCQWSFASSGYKRAIKVEDQLQQQLVSLNQEIYRDDLKRHHLLNYGVCYLSILNLIPSSYEVEDFKFDKSKHWQVEMSLKVNDQEGYEQIPRVALLRHADIKDIFINNQLGKRIKIIL